ncbi:hypothetical protein L1049_010996 [Liquidambar formosana]|uniref:SOSEKI DIX-like domain-containing protein n=1 Tax=Liquidambar formosana TaxID=63359 RepID=A0AAP0X299_LIQFO
MEAKGGQVRRVHIIYFLSRMGRIEHPHLIRVHHLGRNGVYLRGFSLFNWVVCYGRFFVINLDSFLILLLLLLLLLCKLISKDIKRWLADLRGKDMPESFAWSYKRRYKTGYVWQDLLDDDLITPISDNEYVLKGSQISSIPSDPSSNGEKTATIQKQQPVEVEDNKHHPASTTEEEAILGHPDSKMHISAKTSSSSPSDEITQESPPFGSEMSTLTDDSTKLEEDEKQVVEKSKQKLDVLEESETLDNSSSPYLNILLLNKKSKSKKKKNCNKDEEEEKSSSGGTGGSSFSWQSSSTRSRGHSSGASQMFRNLITCGAVDTKDSVMRVIHGSTKKSNKSTGYTTTTSDHNNNKGKSDIICEGDNLGGSARIFGTSWNHQPHYHHQHTAARRSCDGMKDSKKKSSGSSDFFANPKPKAVSAAYKPVAGPNCSQCGKSFKPEKMHKHMKSCRGMKALAKSDAAVVEKTPSQRSMNSSTKKPASGYFLTH